MKKREMGQSVVMGLDDGSTISFWGKAVFFPGDTRRIKVETIRFTEPKPLPKGAFFEDIK